MSTPFIDTPRTWLVMPGEVRKKGAALLHQQCWCWGHDIRRGRGNLLLEHGFSRTRPPQGTRGGTSYQKQISDNASVMLWGFGVCWCERHRGRVFLGRYSLMPRFSALDSAPQDVWTIEQIKYPENGEEDAAFRPPLEKNACRCAVDLLGGALNWMAEYEAGVLASEGPSYRSASLEQWPHVVASPEEVPDLWRAFGTRCRDETQFFHRDESGRVRPVCNHNESP